MSIASVQSTSAKAKTVAFGSNVTAGDLIVVGYGENNGSGGGAIVSDTIGTSFTRIKRTVPSTNNWGYLWVGLAPTSGPNTVTVTSSTSSFEILLVAEFSGCSASLETVTFELTASGYKLSTATDGNLVLTFIAANHPSMTFAGTATTVLVQNAGDGAHDAAGLGWQVGTTSGVQVTDMAESGGHSDNVVIVASFLASVSSSPSKGAARQGAALSAVQSVAYPIDVVAGNLLIVAFGTNTAGTPSVSDSLGTSYTYLGVFTASGNSGHFWYGIAPSSGPNTVTISSTWSFPGIAVAELLNAGAIEVSVTSSAASGYSLTTLTGKDLLITAIMSNHTNAFAVSTGCGFIARSLSNDTIALGYQNGGSAAGSETSGLSGVNTDNAVWFIAFKVNLSASPSVAVSDRLDIRDSLSLNGGPPAYFFLFGDALNTMLDSPRVIPAIVQRFSDTVNNLADALSKMVNIPIQTFDSNQFNWGDSVTEQNLGTFAISKSDALTFLDAVVIVLKNVIINISAADTINLLADAIRFWYILKVTTGDNLTLSDSVQTRFNHFLRLAELLPSKLDAATLSLLNKPVFSDSINSLSDAVSFALAVQLALQKSDTLSLTDAVSISLTGVYTPEDTVARIRRYLGDTQSS